MSLMKMNQKKKGWKRKGLKSCVNTDNKNYSRDNVTGALTIRPDKEKSNLVAIVKKLYKKVETLEREVEELKRKG